MERSVFVNRTLNMKRINYIGLDMDHTLIRYNSRNFEALAHQMMLDKLVNRLGYPKSVLDLRFDFDLAIRGLVIDKHKGNILKLSRHGAIRASFHGSEPIDYSTQRRIYKSTYIDLSDPDYDTVDTTFSIAFAGLFSQLVDLKDKKEFLTMPTYVEMAEDLAKVLDEAHRDGSIKTVVRENIADYVIQDESVVDGLEKFIKHGKKIFILTNSEYEYTKALLDYAINPFVKNHKDWGDLFEFVICSAMKPRFFTDKLGFLKVNLENGSMTNVFGPLEPGVYQGGCATTFTKDLNLNPSEILYVGDHIYGDIVRLKKDCAWRTALVVEELEAEIQKIQQAKPIHDQINKLMEKKIPIEKELDALISEKIEQENDKNQKKIDKLMSSISEIDGQISPLIKQQQNIFNPDWGEVMRVGIEESYFAYQVERYACIYMARLEDLLSFSPRTYFRSRHRPMPHETY